MVSGGGQEAGFSVIEGIPRWRKEFAAGYENGRPSVAPEHPAGIGKKTRRNFQGAKPGRKLTDSSGREIKPSLLI